MKIDILQCMDQAEHKLGMTSFHPQHHDLEVKTRLEAYRTGVEYERAGKGFLESIQT